MSNWLSLLTLDFSHRKLLGLRISLTVELKNNVVRLRMNRFRCWALPMDFSPTQQSLGFLSSFPACKFFNADESAGGIAAFLKKFLSELGKTRAVGHVGDKDSHGDDIIQPAAGGFEGFAHAVESDAHLSVEIARICLTSFI